jgi:acyl carrier protein
MGLADELREVVAMLLWLEPDDVATDASFEALGLDSLGRLELIATVEQHLDMFLPEEEIPELDNIDQVVRYAESLAASGAAP